MSTSTGVSPTGIECTMPTCPSAVGTAMPGSSDIDTDAVGVPISMAASCQPDPSTTATGWRGTPVCSAIAAAACSASMTATVSARARSGLMAR